MTDRVLVAMSGGVDSSVAAARLLAEGWDVIGVTLHLWDYPESGDVRGRCCAPEDIHDARRVADRLGIPHYAFDRRELFYREVVSPFVDAYLDGTTPSPCVKCNRAVKLKELLALADRLETERVATGHYARIDHSGAAARLMRGRDRDKDQSYFLHSATPEQLARLLFPLGDATKATVRQEALDLRLPGAGKGESQELCFVPTGRYDSFVAARAGERVRPGPIVDESGNTIGRHEGVFRFTVGQRKNLGIALGTRAYVTAIDTETATVRLGSQEALYRTVARVGHLELTPGTTLPVDCDVVVRYRGTANQARVVASPGGATIHFASPVRAVVPGQVAVFYSGDYVLGGGILLGEASTGPLRFDARASARTPGEQA